MMGRKHNSYMQRGRHPVHLHGVMMEQYLRETEKFAVSYEDLHNNKLHVKNKTLLANKTDKHDSAVKLVVRNIEVCGF